MAREDYCIASPATSAALFIVTTRNSALLGISYSGSAADTYINIHKGVASAGAKVAMFAIGSTVAGVIACPAPVICSGGICATNIGTVASYVVYYTDV